MKRRAWTPEEERIILKPITSKQAQRELAAIGSKRTIFAIQQRRDHIEIFPEQRQFQAAMIRLGRTARTNGRLWKTSYPSTALREALERGFAKRVGKSTYRITLGGLAWLTRELGPDWEGENQ